MKYQMMRLTATYLHDKDRVLISNLYETKEETQLMLPKILIYTFYLVFITTESFSYVICQKTLGAALTSEQKVERDREAIKEFSNQYSDMNTAKYDAILRSLGGNPDLNGGYLKEEGEIASILERARFYRFNVQLMIEELSGPQSNGPEVQRYRDRPKEYE